MSSTFWSNTIWYILIGILALVQLIAALHAAKLRKLTFAFFLTIMGITLNLETTILIFLKAYTYYPMIIKHSPNPFNDILAGNLFSQFAVSASTLIAVILNLRFRWYLVIAAAYGGVEELFLALGIYSHNWYRTWMTMAMFPFAIALSKYLYRKILEGIRPIYYYFYIFLGLFSLYVVTILWGIQVAGYLDFSTTVLRDSTNSRYFVALTVFFFIPAVAIMFAYFSKLKVYWRVLPIFLLYLLYGITVRLKLVWMAHGSFWVIAFSTTLWMYLSILVLDKFYGGPQNKMIRINHLRK